MVDGIAEEFEAPFVHKKVGGTNASAGDALAVVAVQGKVSNPSIQGIFNELDASPITKVGTNIDVDILLSNLFPQNGDYYFYEGSLTTSNYDETVQWFILSESIKVPQLYLDDLRKIEKDQSGNLLTFNFWKTQAGTFVKCSVMKEYSRIYAELIIIRLGK